MKHLIAKSSAAALVAFLGIGGTVYAQSAPAQQPGQPPIMQQAPEQSREMVQKVQDALKNKGYKVDANGIVGEDTRAALRKYQQENQLPATGTIDSATLTKLGVS